MITISIGGTIVIGLAIMFILAFVGMLMSGGDIHQAIFCGKAMIVIGLLELLAVAVQFGAIIK